MRTKSSPSSPGEGLLGWMPDEAFEVDGILYIAPHVAYRMRVEEHPDAPGPDQGHVVRRPMIGVFPDHVCPDNYCGSEASGRAFRWMPYGNGPQRSSP